MRYHRKSGVIMSTWFPQVKILVFDNYQRCPLPSRGSPGCCFPSCIVNWRDLWCSRQLTVVRVLTGTPNKDIDKKRRPRLVELRHVFFNPILFYKVKANSNGSVQESQCLILTPFPVGLPLMLSSTCQSDSHAQWLDGSLIPWGFGRG